MVLLWLLDHFVKMSIGGMAGVLENIDLKSSRAV